MGFDRVRNGMKLLALLIAGLLLAVGLSTCGGGGGASSSTTVSPTYGSIEGYVYAPVGSGARVAEAVPAGKKAVEGATVSVTCGSTDKNSTTNSSGYFKISSLPTGSCSLTVTYSGFGSYQTSTTVKTNSTSTIGGSNGISLSLATSGSLTVTANISGGTVFIDGEDTGVTIPTGLSYTFDGIAPGEHTVSISHSGYDAVTELNVDVSEGQTAATSFALNPVGNQAPVADAGEDINAFAGTRYIYEGWSGTEYIFTPTPITVTLDGTSSTDPNVDDLSYQWIQTSGPAISLENPTGATISFIPAEQAVYEFSLKVRDGYLESASDTVVVNVAKPTGKLVFACAYKSTAVSEICTMNADGSNLQHLTENSNRTASHPKWSPDGSRIGYSYGDDGFTPSVVAYVNADGTGQLITDIMYGIHDWFPDGTILAWKRFSGQMDLYRANSDGTAEQRLTNIGFVGGSGGRISFDGTKIAFTQNFGGDNYELMAMDADGNNVKRLTTNLVTDGGQCWMPDGTLMYKTIKDFNDWRIPKLFRMNANGTNVSEITVPSGLYDIQGSLTTSTDGRFLFFHGDDEDGIIVMYADGSAFVKLGIGGANLDYHPGP